MGEFRFPGIDYYQLHFHKSATPNKFKFVISSAISNLIAIKTTYRLKSISPFEYSFCVLRI